MITKTGEQGLQMAELTINADKREVCWDLSVQRITLPAGHHGVVCFFTNITERKRSEKALEDSLQKFRSLTKVTSDCIWDWDLTTN